MRRLLVVCTLLVGCESSTGPKDHGYRIDPLPADSTVLFDSSPAWSPNGRTIAYVHRQPQPRGIFAVDLGSDLTPSEPQLLLSLESAPEPEDLRFSPDGTRLAYWAAGNIWMLTIATAEVKQLTFWGTTLAPDWHPDGRRVTYSRRENGAEDPWGIRTVDIVTLEDRPARLQSGAVVYGRRPRWHPDGRSVVVAANDSPPAIGNEYFRVFPDSSERIRLTRLRRPLNAAHWFRNGSELVFTVTSGGPGASYIMAANGSNQRPFLSRDLPIYLGTHFDFSPDETKAVVVRPDATGVNWTLWILRFDVPGMIVEMPITFPPVTNERASAD